MKTLRYYVGASILVGLLELASMTVVHGQVDFDIVYIDREPPAWDPDGACLQDVVETAAQRWEAIFADVPEHDVTLRISWDDPFTGAGLSRFTSGDCVGATTHRRFGALSPNTYTIRFMTRHGDGELPWFVDSTPRNHSEYDMRPRMYLDPFDSATWNALDGTVDMPVEVGMSGLALQEVPSDVACGPATAEDGLDLHSIALHELGHALGLGFVGKADAADDGDYESFLGFGVRVSPGFRDFGHLQSSHALMNSSIQFGERRLPSMADILAIASVNGWPTAYFPRKVWIDAGAAEDWRHEPSWFDAVPLGNEAALLYPMDAPTTVVLADDAFAAGIFLGDLMTVQYGAQTLTGVERLTLERRSKLITQSGRVRSNVVLHHGDAIEIWEGGDLEAWSMVEADNKAEIIMQGRPEDPSRLDVPLGTVRLWDKARLNLTTTLGEVAHLELWGKDTRLVGKDTAIRGLRSLESRGTIQAVDEGLAFTPYDGDVRFELTDVNCRLRAVSGSIRFFAPLSGDFNGDMIVDGSHDLQFVDQVTLSSLSALTLQGDRSSFLADHLVIKLGAELNVTAFNGQIHAPQQWRRGARATVTSGAKLRLLGDSVYLGGGAPLIGAGTVVQRGNALFAESGEFRITAAQYFWDGDDPVDPVGSHSETFIESGSTLIITGQIGTDELDGFDGRIIVEAGAALRVDQDWILEGELVVDGTVLEGGIIFNRGSISGSGEILTEVR